MKITRRAEASLLLANNPFQRKYESEIPCKKCGSVEMRIEFSKGQLSGVTCIACVNSRSKDLKRKMLATIEGKERNKIHQQRYRATDYGALKNRERTRKARSTPVGKEKRDRINKICSKAWRKANTEKTSSYVAKRRADKLQRTPKWADLKAISEFYANRPEGYHVDHIIPLCGELVSGLHVLENLQYLPASENCSKSNNFDPDSF